jgi:signal transduction histidine kinase
MQPIVPKELDPALDGRLRLENLVDRSALSEFVKSFYALSGIPVRIYSLHDSPTAQAPSWQLVADASAEHDICSYVNTLALGRRACASTVSAAKAAEPNGQETVMHPCFTGNAYTIVPIHYDGRRIGKVILGPYATAGLVEPPQSLLDVDMGVDVSRARSLIAKVPKATPETIGALAKHLGSALDLILFSGHKAMMTSQMHLLSVRESYRQLEEKNGKLQEAYDRLKELDRLKSNFLATVSHELRTPLTSIIGYSEMLSEGLAGELTAEQKDFVHTIHEKGEQLLGLIRSLLDLSKLESGTMSLRRKQVVVSDVLQEVLTTLTPNVRKKGVLLYLVRDPAKTEVKGDGERLRQVFVNLVDNAVKFTPAGGSVTMKVRTVEGMEGGEDADSGFALLAPATKKVEVRVADTGIGIPSHERQKVFDAFYQVDSSSTREYGGTGLGLSIVRRLVEAHGGTIAIEENSPQGAVFVVLLPAATAPS